MGFIYKITNLINQKIYIGLTTKVRPTDRYSQHRYCAAHLSPNDNSYLHKAMSKEGLENFSFEIIEEIDNHLLSEREKYWIQKYNSYVPNGYNLTLGGEGTFGYSRAQSEEERQKRSESQRQYFIDHPEMKQVIKERTKQLWMDPEYRKKVTESNKKFYSEHPDKFAGENNPFYGKHHTPERIE